MMQQYKWGTWDNDEVLFQRGTVTVRGSKESDAAFGVHLECESLEDIECGDAEEWDSEYDASPETFARSWLEYAVSTGRMAKEELAGLNDVGYQRWLLARIVELHDEHGEVDESWWDAARKLVAMDDA